MTKAKPPSIHATAWVDLTYKWIPYFTEFLGYAPKPAPVATEATDIQYRSFQANWRIDSRFSEYYFDASLDSDFNVRLPDYNALPLIDNFIEVADIPAGTTVYYRLRGMTDNGLSNYSNIIMVTTKTVPAPIALDPVDILKTSFTARWSPPGGINLFYFDLSKDYFATKVAEYDNRLVNGSSLAITGLKDGTSYQYRLVSALPTGDLSVSSNIIETATSRLPPPRALPATNIVDDAFRANWEAGTNITEYYFELSTDGFVTKVPGYDNILVFDTYIDLTGLIPDTLYQYRVKAGQDMIFISVNSNTISTTTSVLINPPLALPASDITTSSFTANWEDVV